MLKFLFRKGKSMQNRALFPIKMIVLRLFSKKSRRFLGHSNTQLFVKICIRCLGFQYTVVHFFPEVAIPNCSGK